MCVCALRKSYDASEEMKVSRTHVSNIRCRMQFRLAGKYEGSYSSDAHGPGTVREVGGRMMPRILDLGNILTIFYIGSFPRNLICLESVSRRRYYLWNPSCNVTASLWGCASRTFFLSVNWGEQKRIRSDPEDAYGDNSGYERGPSLFRSDKQMRLSISSFYPDLITLHAEQYRG
jgi:hypothetical protein